VTKSCCRSFPAQTEPQYYYQGLGCCTLNSALLIAVRPCCRWTSHLQGQTRIRRSNPSWPAEEAATGELLLQLPVSEHFGTLGHKLCCRTHPACPHNVGLHPAVKEFQLVIHILRRQPAQPFSPLSLVRATKKHFNALHENMIRFYSKHTMNLDKHGQ
jgi:hypothetical protein